MNAIRDWLYVGKYRETLDPSALRAEGIQAILQLAEASRQSDLPTLFLPVQDGSPLPADVLRRGVDFVRQQRRIGVKVLVACGAGQSRSVAFAVAALKEEEELLLLDALRAVKKNHPETLLHPALWQSLCAFYREDIHFRIAFRVMRSRQ
jgi:protein-tyrosine phosphatase